MSLLDLDEFTLRLMIDYFDYPLSAVRLAESNGYLMQVVMRYQEYWYRQYSQTLKYVYPKSDNICYYDLCRFHDIFKKIMFLVSYRREGYMYIIEDEDDDYYGSLEKYLEYKIKKTNGKIKYRKSKANQIKKKLDKLNFKMNEVHTSVKSELYKNLGYWIINFPLNQQIMHVYLDQKVRDIVDYVDSYESNTKRELTQVNDEYRNVIDVLEDLTFKRDEHQSQLKFHNHQYFIDIIDFYNHDYPNHLRSTGRFIENDQYIIHYSPLRGRSDPSYRDQDEYKCFMYTNEDLDEYSTDEDKEIEDEDKSDEDEDEDKSDEDEEETEESDEEIEDEDESESDEDEE